MGETTGGEVTQLLGRLIEGDRASLDRLWDLLYQELRSIAHSQLRGRGRTLNTTALVHEAYLKLVAGSQLEIRDRSHFFSLAARVMRQIAVDIARQRAATKRGGDRVHLDLDDVELPIEQQADELILLDQALERLTLLNERLTRVFECRFFAGLSEDETAQALDVSLRTVQRDWMKSKAWLRRELAP